MNEINLLQGSFLLFLIAAIVSFITSKISKKAGILMSSFLGVIASLMSFFCSILVLLHKGSFSFELSQWSQISTLKLSVDPLAAFFILLISLLNIPILIYSVGYLKSEYIEKDIASLCALHHLFVVTMLLVVCAADGFLFLFLWECMTLLSFAFVISNTKSAASKDAGFIYLLMTHVASAFLFVFFFVFAKYSGSFAFDSFQAVGQQIPIQIKNLLFIFLLIGFGTKAGLVPFHIWLPEAHPAAPSHISALMSGAMIKIGVYGILRFVFDFLSPFPSWWGILLAAISILSALLGIIYASGEVNLKRLLAFSSIENIGVILLPIGVGMTFYSIGQNNLASILIIAGMLHALNHSLFKGLLFMASGAVISATHTGNIDKLGGLIKYIPQTAFLFLVGVLSICAFPPFNGFASEWMIIQGLLSVVSIKFEGLKILIPIFAALLGLTGAICAATFLKTFSGIFLALPRSHQIKHTREVSFSMRFSMMILGALCLFLGVFPGYICKLLNNVIQSLNLNPASVTVANNLQIQLEKTTFGTLSTVIIFIALSLLLLLVFFVSKVFGRKSKLIKDQTWSCGVSPSFEFEHTPTGYAQPLQIIFSELHAPESFYHDAFYLPVVNWLMKLANKARPIQAGNLQVYLTYIFITLIVCLVGLLYG